LPYKKTGVTDPVFDPGFRRKTSKNTILTEKSPLSTSNPNILPFCRQRAEMGGNWG
jgi:hypothetical protein